MHLRLRYSAAVYCGIMLLHLLALLAIVASAIPIWAGCIIAAASIVSALIAHADYCESSSRRLRSIAINQHWSELRDQQLQYRLALPEIIYYSEFLILLHFTACEDDPAGSENRPRNLLILPGMLSQQDNCRLRRYLLYELPIKELL